MNLIEFLDAKNTRIFMVPSNHTLNFMNNLSTSIKEKTTIWNTESGAGYGTFASSVFEKIAPTLIITAGPGITNVVSVIAQAYNDSLPLIVFGINNWKKTLDKRSGTIHELGWTNNFFKTITLKNECIKSESDFCQKIDYLYYISKKCAKPIYIDIPSDIFDDLIKNNNEYKSNKILINCANANFIEKCFNKIVQAKKAILYCGWQTVINNLVPKIEELSNILNIPIVTTIETSSFYGNENHIGPLWDRIFSKGEYGKQADFVLALGCDFSAMDTNNEQLNINELIGVSNYCDINSKYKENIKIYDLENFVIQLLYQAKSNNIHVNNLEFINILKQERKHQCMIYNKNVQFSTILNKLLETFSDTFFCIDVCLPGFLLEHFWTKKNNLKFFSSQKYVNLGSALQVSLGAEMIGKKAVCIVGDGGLNFSISEMSIAKKYNINIRIILFNNNSFETIKQNAITNKNLYNLTNPNYMYLANAYNIKYYNATEKDFIDKIINAESENVSYLLEVKTVQDIPLFNKINWEY